MATTKPIRDLGTPVTPVGTELILIDNGVSMKPATINDAVSPKASALIAANNAVYDPQGIAGDAFARANHTGTQTLSTISDAGTAAAAAATDFATAAQGALADTATQPGDLGNSAALDVGTTAGTVAAGDDGRITGAIQPSATDASSFDFVLDEDDMASDSDTKVPTQQSVNQGKLQKVATRTAMKTLDGSKHLAVYLMEAGREGTFQWDSSDLSAKVTADTAEGIYVAPSIDTTGASGAWVRQHSGRIHPSWFGVVGDGTTDDTVAWQALANFICRYGGRVVGDPQATYLINSTITFKPQQNDGYSPPYNPPSGIIFNLPGKPWLDIDLNGAVIKAGAVMTEMFHFVSNPGLASPEVAPFFARVKRGRFDGQGNAALGIHMDWCLGADVELNLVSGCATSIKVEGYGIHYIRKNELRFKTAGIDLTAGGADSLYFQNDFYTDIGADAGAACFLLGNQGTAQPGQMRIWSNAATNEGQGTAYFVKVAADVASAIIRNADVSGNGIAGFDYLIYARGKSATNNLKYWTVHHNNCLNYDSKTSLALVSTTETEGWIISENAFNPQFGLGVTSSLICIGMTNSVRDRVAGNYIMLSKGGGVRMDFANRSEITGNKLYNCGDGSAPAIVLASSSQKNLVYGNVIDNSDTSNFCQIAISEGTGGDYNVGALNMANNVTTKYSKVGANTSFT